MQALSHSRTDRTERTSPMVDPNTVVALSADCALTLVEMDRWSNRLARLLLLRHPGVVDATIAIAVDPQVERMVAECAIGKLGGRSVLVADGETAAPGARIGITTSDRRPELSDDIAWLVLDAPATLRHYLSGSDAPLTVREVSPMALSA